MLLRQILVSVTIGFGFVFALPVTGLAQVYVLSAEPPRVEYQYQLHYPRVYGWPGPGLSLGGTLPAKGREGISSLYGLPFPAPLGAGVYVNPFAYSTRLPGPFAFGLASSSSPTQNSVPGQTGQPISQLAATNAAGQLAPGRSQAGITTELHRQVVPPSSSAAIERSREMEAIGDAHFKQQRWIQAYVNYHNATLVAGDQAEAHLRLAFACMAMKKFPEAASEFKRAFIIDPKSAIAGETLESLYGTENTATSPEIVRTVAEWTKQDLRNQDRLFLLGVVLHYNNDARSDEILQAAMQLDGPKEHLTAILTSPRSAPDLLPELHQQPLALQ